MFKNRPDSTNSKTPVEGLRIDLASTGLADIPFRHDRKWILRFEAGLLLDVHLRRLARVSGGTDRALALRLHRLRQTRGFVRLGYSSFGDFVRERVGISVRSAQELVRLARALARLPRLDAALKRGRLTWSAAAQVARVAGPEDEAAWVRWGESLSVRQLKERVSEFLDHAEGASSSDSARNGVPSHVGADGLGSVASEEVRSTRAPVTDDDDDPLVRMSVETTQGVAMLWQAALDLGELLAGGDLSEGEGPEYILADTLSGGHPAAAGAAELVAGEPIPVKHPRPTSERQFIPGAPFGIADSPAEELGPRALPVDLRDETQQLLDMLEDVDSPVPDDPFLIDASLRRVVRARGSVELDLARLLRNFQSLNLHLHLGFESFGDYVEERLCISASRARWLARLDRKMSDCPRVAEALGSGRIGTVAAMLVCRIAVCDKTESAWVLRATERTVRRLKEEVLWAERESLLGRRHEPMPPAEQRLRSSLEELSQELQAQRLVAGPGWETSAQVVGVEPGWETSAQVVGVEPGWETSAQVVGVEPGWETSAQVVGAGPGWEEAAGSDWLRDALCGAVAGSERSARARVEFSLRESVLDMWKQARSLIKLTTGGAGLSQSDTLRHLAVEFLATHLPLWLEELRHGDPIAVRERFRCGIPGCSSRGGSGHHIRYRSQGGSDEPGNLLFVCFLHHIEGVHRNRIRVRGTAPDHLVVELGIRPDGTALETFVDGVRQSATSPSTHEPRPGGA